MFQPLDALAPSIRRELDAGVPAPLQPLAARFASLFVMRSPFAPAAMLVGGVVPVPSGQADAHGAPSFSVSGNGLELVAAVTSCLGEAAEALSQIDDGRATILARPDLVDGWIAGVIPEPDRPVSCIPGREMPSGRVRLVPADLVIRRAPGDTVFVPPGARGTGVAAGADGAAAAERAVLELVERDAAALWWFGGVPPKALSPTGPVAPAAMALIDRLRAGGTPRVTRLLDLTGDLGIPVVAACSCDPNGFDLACGVAARRDVEAAATAALLELMQMELASVVADLKRADPLAVLNEADRRHLARRALDMFALPTFAPASERGVPDAPPAGDPFTALAERGVAVTLVDLTRDDVGVPVIRALAPALQPFSPAVITPRLARAISGSGARAGPAGVTPF